MCVYTDYRLLNVEHTDYRLLNMLSSRAIYRKTVEFLYAGWMYDSILLSSWDVMRLKLKLRAVPLYGRHSVLVG